MPAALLHTEALVLAKRPPAESFQNCTLFSPAHGVLTAFIRLPKARQPRFVLDLFDEAAVELETSNQGRTWFVRDARVLARGASLGRSYDALRAASALASLVARNPPGEENRPMVAGLLKSALAALASGGDPDAVLFKSMFRHARDEGYPVKEDWLAGLPAGLRADAQRLLRTPLAALDPSRDPKAAQVLQRRLEDYLRQSTEILLE